MIWRVGSSSLPENEIKGDIVGLAVTDHGRKRIRQRIGPKVPDKLVKQAYKKGIGSVEARGQLKKYIDKLSMESQVEVKVLHHNVFLFGRDKALVTTFTLPSNLRKHVDRIKNKEKSNE